MAKSDSADTELTKWIKEMYSNDCILGNIADSFVIAWDKGSLITQSLITESLTGIYLNVIFPKTKFYIVFGRIRITGYPNLLQWFGVKSGSIELTSSEVRELKDLKIKDILKTEYAEDYLKVSTASGKEYILKRETPMSKIDYNFGKVYIPKTEIALDSKDSVITLHHNAGKIVDKEHGKMLLEIPTKNVMIFQKSTKATKKIAAEDPKYYLEAYDKNGTSDFKYIILKSEKKNLELKQILKVAAEK